MQGIVQLRPENGDRFMRSAVIIQKQTQGKQKYHIGNFGPLMPVLGKKDENQQHCQKVLNADIPAEIVHVHNAPK